MISRHRSVSQPMCQINVTSLLDVVFVLLIALMVVAPALKYGVEIDLPTVRKAPVVKQDKPITISIKSESGRGETIYLDGQPIELKQLVGAIGRAGGAAEARPVTLEGDKRANWETIAQVIAELREGGITNIGIITNVSES